MLKLTLCTCQKDSIETANFSRREEKKSNNYMMIELLSQEASELQHCQLKSNKELMTGTKNDDLG